MSREEMVRDLLALAERFSEGWHDGIKIDALDIELLADAARALAEQPAQQEPVARQYQGRDGVWKDFISEKHYKATLEDGSWPIRNLYHPHKASRGWG